MDLACFMTVNSLVRSDLLTRFKSRLGAGQAELRKQYLADPVPLRLLHERRSQVENRRMAIRRLRRKLASHVRTGTNRDVHRCSDLWTRRRQGNKLPVNPDHDDYPGLLAEALDLVVARRYDVAGAAALLGITMSQLSRLINHDKGAFAKLNAGREGCGLPPLRK